MPCHYFNLQLGGGGGGGGGACIKGGSAPHSRVNTDCDMLYVLMHYYYCR